MKMNRPYTICHILSALDGKITGPFMGTESNRKTAETYGKIRMTYHAQAWLYGTTTTKEFTGYKIPAISGSTVTVPEGDHIAVENANLYYVSVDT